MRVLVVEDDPALGIFLQKGLMLEGHDVAWVDNGDAALEQAIADNFDLMVLDLSLPGRDGTEVLEEMRRLSPGTAVLILTGRTKVEERVRCLNLGADDFLLKPFSFHELTARCRAVLRRREHGSAAVLRFSGLELKLAEQILLHNGTEIELTRKEFAFLEFLVRKQGHCATRAELLEKVWRLPADRQTNTVDVCVNSLRKKLSSASHGSQLDGPVVETVRGQGYRLRCLRERSHGSRPFDDFEMPRPA